MNFDITPIMENLKKRYPIERNSEQYKSVYEKSNPLVTVVMTTFDRCETLFNYSLKSVLEQTYKNLEIIVMGDRCTDNTEEEMNKLMDRDKRVKFINLIERPEYQTDPRNRWYTIGVYPYNLGLEKTTGDFLTHLDDDDSFTLDRIEKLVKFIQENKYDAVHHPFTLPPTTNASGAWACNHITTSALFLHGWFKNLPADPFCYLANEPGDWNRCRKILELGAKIGRHPDLMTYKMASTRRNTF